MLAARAHSRETRVRVESLARLESGERRRAVRVLPASRLTAAATNVATKALYGGVADTRPVPRALVHHIDQGSLYRMGPPEVPCDGPPVLLVPPLAAPATCFDLRRGCSLAEHLVGQRYHTHLLDYGGIEFADRTLGLERWVTGVLPTAIRRVSEASDGRPVHLVAWCLGGLFSLLTAASQAGLPIASISTVGSPIDFSRVTVAQLIAGLDRVGGDHLLTGAYRMAGIAPSPLVKLAYQGVGVEKYLTRPYTTLTRLHDRGFLAQLEAVDRFMNSMIPYPGRVLGQIYHAFVRANALSTGELALAGRTVNLADIDVPVLAVAGAGDGIAPRASVERARDLLTGAPEVRFEVHSGGHLGVLTGRAARDTTWLSLRKFITEHS